MYASFPINSCQWLTILIFPAVANFALRVCVPKFQYECGVCLLLLFVAIYGISIDHTQNLNANPNPTENNHPFLWSTLIDNLINDWLIDWSAARRIYDIVECLGLIVGPEKLSNMTIIYHLFYKISYRTPQSFFL